MNRINNAGLACAEFVVRVINEMRSSEEKTGNRKKKSTFHVSHFTFHSLGFTLAEILITLCVIGIIAGMTIPVFHEKIQDRLLARAKADAQTKIIEAVNQMGMNNVLVGYTTNEAFADEFQKYMKIANRCDSTNLTKCFPATIKSAGGTVIDTSTLTTGDALKSGNYSVPTVGLGLANGTAIIFGLKALTGAADDPCLKLDPMNGAANGADGSGILSCVSMLYDVNGFKGPNVLGTDIATVNVVGLVCAGVKTADGTCFSNAFAPTPMSLADCQAAVAAGNQWGITSCNYNTDYWAGAAKACGGADKLPTQEQLDALANKLYNVSNCGTITCNGILNYSEATKAGLPSSGSFYLWSSVELNSASAYGRRFTSTDSDRGSSNRITSSLRAVCLGN